MLYAQSITKDYISAEGDIPLSLSLSLVERNNKAEIRPEEQSQKAESYRENLWNEIQLKGP